MFENYFREYMELVREEDYDSRLSGLEIKFIFQG